MLGQYHRGQHCSVASKKATFARGENSGVTKQNSEVTGVQELQNGIQAFRSVDGESCPLKAIGIFLKKKASEMLKGKFRASREMVSPYRPKSLDPILQLL
jgi:hypothetical protein